MGSRDYSEEQPRRTKRRQAVVEIKKMSDDVATLKLIFNFL